MSWRCWFRHKWSAWCAPRLEHIVAYTSNGLACHYDAMVQNRGCERCGKVDSRHSPA